MRVLTVLTIMVTVLFAASCGSDSETDTSDVPLAPIEISELLETEPAEASVIGYVVLDAGGDRLCEVLAESFPPQCGGASVLIANADDLTVALEQEQSTSWTNERVQLDGTYDGETFTITN